MKPFGRLSLCLLLVLSMLSGLWPLAPAQAASLALVLPITPTDDARTQAGSPDQNFPESWLYLSTLNGHRAYLKFSLLDLPIDATITSAELKLHFTSVLTGPNDIEVGRAEAQTTPWTEETLTWNTQPTVTWGGPVQNVSVNGDYSWDVTQLVRQWHKGTVVNNGFALRGSGGPLVAATSKETGQAPELLISYSVPTESGQRPDFGDAPDSTNNRGISNTAYVGVPGNFPTVWLNTPANQAAGPRHLNQTGQGLLGLSISREAEADGGQDQDGINNILNGNNDNADNDRSDDGWRNRTVAFPPCERTTLRVRVSKTAAATLNRMYLNVWFDGNRDGDWQDRGPCTPQGENLAIAASEWIVQDYSVDMTGIAAGGYVDIDITTEAVLNLTPNAPHWMRFTLSDTPAIKNANGYADGRGPNPNSTPNSFLFGETEDVLQKPQPRGEDGTLELSKQVIVDGAEPVEWIDYVTYEIKLRHKGGSQAIQARIRDLLPYPLIVYPTVSSSGIQYIEVSSNGGATPLNANLAFIPPSGIDPPQQEIRWDGSLPPDSIVTLRFQVRVISLCEANQQTKEFLNRAEARTPNGPVISAEDRFLAKCIGADSNNINVELEPAEFDNLDLQPDDQFVPWQATITNNQPYTVTLGFFQKPISSTLAANLPGRPLGKQQFAPNERRNVRLQLKLNTNPDQELNLPADFSQQLVVGYCLMFEGMDRCPDPQRFPALAGEAPALVIQPRPNDLGDAPDSTNHPAIVMAAYPGTPASFPTVFDPAVGLPMGPRHAFPRPFHLGPQVSREAEADVGPDQDPSNNIEPAANDPDNDRFDDGAQPNQWSLSNCQRSTFPVRLFISPQAVNWFQQQPQQKAWLNIWIDSNRDGSWDDGTQCGAGPDGGGPPAVEHIVIDQPIDVVGLGAGLQTITVTTGLVPWPAALAQQPAWVRVTLSERESNKPFQIGPIKYGDGRGFPAPFQTGETEDYLRGGQNQHDLAVELNGRVTAGAGQNPQDLLGYKLGFANLSDQVISGATLIFTKPLQLRDLEIELFQAGRIPRQNISETPERVIITLPDLPAGSHGNILLGWKVARDQAPTGDFQAQLEGRISNDANPSDNLARLSLGRGQISQTIAMKVGDGSLWGSAETTCRTEVQLGGNSIPGAAFDVWVDGAIRDALVDNDTIWNYTLTNLSDGQHTMWITPNAGTTQSAAVSLDVDTSLPIDPISLTFTDSQGRVFHPSTLGWPRSINQFAARLQVGETYEIAINRCGTNPNQRIEVQLGNTSVVMLDEDGDGRYVGSLSYNPPTQAGLAATDELIFHVNNNSTVQQYSGAVIGSEPGRVQDRATGNHLSGAKVSALGSQNNGEPFSLWPVEALGQANPQTTGSSGQYRFNVPGGTSRVLVEQAGYQPYQSWNIDTQNGILEALITLTAEINQPVAQTIYITEQGFEPAIVTLTPGSVVEWVNLDLNDRSSTGANWDSGALSSGGRYRTKVNETGSYSYYDAANPLNRGLLIVDGPPPSKQVLLALILR